MFLQTFFQNVYFYLVFSFNVCRRKTMYFQRFKRFLTSELPKWSKRPICSFSHQCTFEPPFKKQMNSTCKFDSRKGEYNLQMAQMSRICPSYRDTRSTRRKRTGSLIDSSLALEKKNHQPPLWFASLVSIFSLDGTRWKTEDLSTMVAG